MADPIERILCIASEEKGQEFLRQCAEMGVRPNLLTLERLRDGDWPREVLEELRDATLNGNKKLLNDLILKLRKGNDDGCADGVQDLANKYQYQSLAQLLEEACSL